VEESGRRGPGGGLASEVEDIKLVEFTLLQVWEMLASKAVQDAKTLIGLQWLRSRLREEA